MSSRLWKLQFSQRKLDKIPLTWCKKRILFTLTLENATFQHIKIIIHNLDKGLNTIYIDLVFLKTLFFLTINSIFYQVCNSINTISEFL